MAQQFFGIQAGYAGYAGYVGGVVGRSCFDAGCAGYAGYVEGSVGRLCFDAWHAGYAGYAGCVLGRLCFDARHGYAGSVLRGSWQEVFVVKRQGVPGAVCELCTRGVLVSDSDAPRRTFGADRLGQHDQASFAAWQMLQSGVLVPLHVPGDVETIAFHQRTAAIEASVALVREVVALRAGKRSWFQVLLVQASCKRSPIADHGKACVVASRIRSASCEVSSPSLSAGVVQGDSQVARIAGPPGRTSSKDFAARRARLRFGATSALPRLAWGAMIANCDARSCLVV